jgi:hypothetical protein
MTYRSFTTRCSLGDALGDCARCSDAAVITITMGVLAMGENGSRKIVDRRESFAL